MARPRFLARDDARGHVNAEPEPTGSLMLSLRDAVETADPLREQEALAGIEERMFGKVATPVPQVSRYQLRSRIGSGGMGVVYEAYDPDPRPPRRRQAPQGRAPRPGRSGRAPPRPRSPRDRQDQRPPRHRDLRCRPRRRVRLGRGHPRLHRHGARRGLDPRPVAHRRRHRLAPDRRRLRASRPGPRRGPPGRPPASRLQAAKRHGRQKTAACASSTLGSCAPSPSSARAPAEPRRWSARP